MSRPKTNSDNTEDMQDDSTARMLFGTNNSGVFDGMVDTENHADDARDPESGDVLATES